MRRSARTEAALVALLVATPFVVGVAHAEEPPAPEVAFTVTDHRVVESSGLAWADVDGERWVATVNDSGDTGQVFTLDPATGEVVGTTTFTPHPRDVEALAPAGDGHVWVADVGDNLRARDSLVLTRVAVGSGDREASDPRRLEVRYPDRPRDAEAVVVHPRTGRIFVVTKSVLGGQVWAVPADARPGEVAVLEEVAAAPGVVTDGAFTPSGDHVLLRNYTHAFLLTFPEWEVVATIELPAQPQGEGLTVLPDGEVLVSTEGRGRDVLRVALPDGVRSLVRADVARAADAHADPVRRWWREVWERWTARF